MQGDLTRAIVTELCRRKYRERSERPGLSDEEVDERVRQEVSSGRPASLRETRDILAAQERATTGGRPFSRTESGRQGRVRFVVAGDLYYVVGQDRGGSGEPVVVTCWPMDWVTEPE